MLTNHFAILGLEANYTLTQTQQTELEQRYQQAIIACHPDNFSSNPQNMQIAMQKTIALNDAYAVITDPVKRANHLLELRFGEQNEQHSNTDSALLFEIMELREQYEQINTPTQRNDFLCAIQQKKESQIKKIEQLFSTNAAEHDIKNAIAYLQFICKLAQSTQ